MGIFGRRLPATEEEKWAATQAGRSTPAPRQAPAQPAAPAPAPRSTRDPLKGVIKAGRMYLRGGTLVLDGWQFESDDLPTGPLRGHNTRKNTVAGLTPKQLHDIAEGHGPSCRCGIGRTRRP